MLLCSRKEHTLDPQQPGWVLKTLCWVTVARTLHTALPHLYATLEKAKLQVQKIDQFLPGISDQRVAPKGNGNVWGGRVLYLDLGGGHTTKYVCPKGTLQGARCCVKTTSPSNWHEKYICGSVLFISVQSLSRVRLFVTPRTAARQASLSITNSQSLLKLMSIESVRPSNHLILCRPLLLPPLIFPSNRVFSSESVLRIRWPKYWSFSFSISPFNEYSGLVSFRMDWFNLLAVQGTLKSLLQHHSSKISILHC